MSVGEETRQEILVDLKACSRFVGSIFCEAIVHGDRKTVQQCLQEQQRLEREIKALESKRA